MTGGADPLSWLLRRSTLLSVAITLNVYRYTHSFVSLHYGVNFWLRFLSIFVGGITAVLHYKPQPPYSSMVGADGGKRPSNLQVHTYWGLPMRKLG